MSPEAQGATSQHDSAEVCIYYAVANEASECANGHVRHVKDYLILIQFTEPGLNTQTGHGASHACSQLQSPVSLQCLISSGIPQVSQWLLDPSNIDT